MSDYLSELTARSLGTAEVVQPRLTSRFEPAMYGGALDPAPPGFGAADMADGLAEFSAGAIVSAGTREQPFAPAGAYERPSMTSRPAHLHVGELEPQPSYPQRSPNAQSVDPAASVTPVNRPLTMPGRSEPVNPTEDQFEDIRRPTQLTVGAASSPQPQDKGGALVFQSGLSAQTPVRSPSRQAERDFDEQIRAAVDDAVAQQGAKSDDDNPGQVDRNSASSLVGQRPGQSARDLDERVRSAIDGVLAGQRNGNDAQDFATAGRHRSAQVEYLEERSTKSRTIPSRKESTPDVQPAVLTRVITQPHVAIASPALPGSSAGAAAESLYAHREPQPPPTIQVTIGRIEVRATPAPAAGVTNKSRQPSAISLDEYLRQRNRGGQ